jgi:hypothetical protein
MEPPVSIKALILFHSKSRRPVAGAQAAERDRSTALGVPGSTLPDSTKISCEKRAELQKASKRKAMYFIMRRKLG